MNFLNKKIQMRINDSTEKRIKQLLYLTGDKYFNKSHFIRVAIVKEIRHNEEELKKKFKD